LAFYSYSIFTVSISFDYFYNSFVSAESLLEVNNSLPMLYRILSYYRATYKESTFLCKLALYFRKESTFALRSSFKGSKMALDFYIY
jgi:hypothetical protein